jgi:protein SCO1/2
MNRDAMSKLVSNRRTLLIASALASLLTLSGCGGASQTAERPPLEGSSIGGPFTLVDKNGHTVRWSDFAGKYRIVYFGYSFCPDACPTDMQATMRGLNIFAKAHPDLAADISPMFISIDPARDTPKVVGEFAAAFSPRLIGLTGTQAQVDQAAKAFAVYHARGVSTPGGYLMDHSRIVYLMGRQGEPLAMLAADKGPQAVADDLTEWVH